MKENSTGLLIALSLLCVWTAIAMFIGAVALLIVMGIEIFRELSTDEL